MEKISKKLTMTLATSHYGAEAVLKSDHIPHKCQVFSTYNKIQSGWALKVHTRVSKNVA